MTNIQVVLLFACMYAALVIVAELIYMILDSILSDWQYRQWEKQCEEKWREMVFYKRPKGKCQ